MTGQAQRSATGVGQHRECLAVQAGADHAAVVQAGDQEVVLQQQGFGAVDVRRADVLHALEYPVLGKYPRLQGRRGLRFPGHRLHLGRCQQQEQADQHQKDDEKPANADSTGYTTHQATAPVRVGMLSCAWSRKASIDAADSCSMRRLSSN
ncbi:hypothetical protein D3C80_1592090 [compost metagenome]